MRRRLLFAGVLVVLLHVNTLAAQVGKSQGVLDANVVTEAELTAVPGLTPALVKAVVAARPFASIGALDAVLAPALSPAQRTEVYKKIFVHLNLNTATSAEIVLVPGAGKRMAREFAEYRPWTSLTQFDKEIGKYVDAAELARLQQYVFVPIDLNTASDEAISSIPGLGRRMLREFKEYRPYTDLAQFRKEIGKYVDAKEVARLERFVTIGK